MPWQEDRAALLAAEEKAAQDELEQWQGMFEVEASGEGAEGDEGTAFVLADFIAAVKRQKVVVLEELAAARRDSAEHCFQIERALHYPIG